MDIIEFRTAAAAAVAIAAAICDVRTRRIPNVLTLGASAAALLYALAIGGPWALLIAAAGWLVGAALFFPFFALGGMGAGDVKLLSALGAWLGPADAVWLAIFASMTGGVLAIGVAVQQRYLRQAGVNLWLMLMHWRTAGLKPMAGLTLGDRSAPRLAYAIPIAIGLVCTIWQR